MNYLSMELGILTTTVQWIWWSLALAITAYFRFDFLNYLISCTRGFLSERNTHSAVNNWLSALVVFILCATWLLGPGMGALFPPTEFDLLITHLTLPQAYLYNEGFVNATWLRAPVIPQLVHAIFTGGMSWTRFFTFRVDLFPTFLSSWVIIFCLVGFVELFEGFPRHGISAFILLLSFPVVRWHLRTAYMDSFLMFGILATFLASIALISTKQVKYFYLVALFSGTCFSIKHFGAPYAIPFAVVTFFFVITVFRISAFRHIVIALICGLAPVALFYFQNYRLADSFLFPFIYTENNHFYWDRESQNDLNFAIDWFLRNRVWTEWLTLPWLISTSKKYSDSGGFNVSLLWLPAWIIPNAYFLYRLLRQKLILPIEYLLFFALNFQLFYWFHTSPVFRYLSCVLMLVSIFGVWMLRGTPLKIILPIIGVFLVFSSQNFQVLEGAVVANPFTPQLPPPVKVAEIQDYLESHTSSYRALRRLQKVLSNPEKILIYNLHDEGNLLYYPFPHLGDWFTLNGYRNFLPQNLPSLREFLSSRKITHVLYNQSAAPLIKNFPDDLGPYATCFRLILEDRTINKIKIFEVQRQNPFCYDPSVQAHETAEIVMRSYPIFKDYSFEKKPARNQ